jgi:hypothetical protein
MLTVEYMSKDDTLMGGFLQNSGAGVGPQTLVRQGRLSTPANPQELEKGAGKGRKTKLAAFGLSPAIIKAGDPDYARCLAQANKYRKTRMRELAGLHGNISAGAGALLASASLALAASRYLYQLAAGGADPGLLKQAASLADSARQSELAAWEVSAKEGVLKRRQDAAEAGMPWLMKLDGNDKAKLGRKTNAERQERKADVPINPVLDSDDA